MAAAPAFTCALRSSAVFGITFQVGGGGAAMIFCICGLTVSGTGTLCPGTSRAHEADVWATAADAARMIAPASAQDNPAMSRAAAKLRVIGFLPYHPAFLVELCRSSLRSARQRGTRTMVDLRP